MALTKGHGNPNWSRDETILALKLYQDCKGQVPIYSDPRVISLSKILNALPIHDPALRKDNFRNPDGVAFKLQNLRQVATGKGLSNVSNVDREVWQDLGDKPELVSVLANKIAIAGAVDGVTVEDVAAVDDDEEFAEGRVLTASHRRRERNPKVRKRLIEKRLKSDSLMCDACGDRSKVNDASLAFAGFEVHHLIPLSTTEIRKTKLDDLALMCATCHRVIHRAIHSRRRWISIVEFKAMLK